MGSYIADNRLILSQRHYIRKAGTEGYWFDFSFNKLNRYKDQFSFAFCMVLYGSEDEDDAYVMPYSEVASFFTEDSLDHRRRWIGAIHENVLRLNSQKAMSVSPYYNVYELLDVVEVQESSVAERTAPYTFDHSVDSSALKQKIRMFNEHYCNIVPHKRRVVSEEVARPGIVTDYLKQLHNHTCQLCGEQGFMQRNGMRYIETHHIQELHRLVPGSYCSDNIVVVCATCHRKLHYAHIEYSFIHDDQVAVLINEVRYVFTRNILLLDNSV